MMVNLALQQFGISDFNFLKKSVRYDVRKKFTYVSSIRGIARAEEEVSLENPSPRVYSTNGGNRPGQK
uniref:Uncharacterized protein n=1 Tax=Salix viminalis TaxID=40686 RepID=A0A6N2LRW2_SALVM